MTNPTQQLHDLGQSLWLDNITREMIQNGTLRRYIDELSVTGLTSNPTIYDQAIESGAGTTTRSRPRPRPGLSGEELFFELALEDLTQAADLFRPVHEATDGVDGWVSLEVSPLLAHDTERTIEQVTLAPPAGERPNLFIKIPGTPEGLPAIEESIFAGVPVNVTLLFSRGAVSRGGRGVSARASSAGSRPGSIRGRLGGVGVRQPLGQGGAGPGAGRAPRPAGHRDRRPDLSGLPRAAGLARSAAARRRRCPAPAAALGQHRHQGPQASDVLYIEALAAPDTINTMPETTLLAFADHGEIRGVDGGGWRATPKSVLAEFERAGIDVDALGRQLQREGAEAFVKSWKQLLERIAAKSEALAAS